MNNLNSIQSVRVVQSSLLGLIFSKRHNESLQKTHVQRGPFEMNQQIRDVIQIQESNTLVVPTLLLVANVWN